MGDKKQMYNRLLNPSFDEGDMSLRTRLRFRNEMRIIQSKQLLANGKIAHIPEKDQDDEIDETSVMDTRHDCDDFFCEEKNITREVNDCDLNDDDFSDCFENTDEIYSDCSCCSDRSSETDEKIISDSNEFNASQVQNNRIMFPAAELTVADVIFMVQMFSIAKNLTKNDENDLLELVKTLAGPEFKEWESSHYERSKAFCVPDDKITLSFFCEKCNVILTKKYLKNCVKKEKMTCTTCSEKFEISSQSSNSFMSPDIRYQIELILNQPELQEDLFKNIKKMNHSSTDICDVQDSKLYKKLKANNSDLLTLNFNTDRALLFKSSKNSFWPQQLYVNELPLELRFKHIILGGIFLTSREPNPQFMNLYNAALCDQIVDLSRNGVNIYKYSTQEIVNLKFTLLCCCYDTPARALCQNRTKFNGYWGCSWCYEPGVYVGNAIHYPIVEVEAPLRSYESHLSNVEEVQRLQNSSTRKNYVHKIMGVKGSMSFIEKLLSFDSVWGFPNDYMHSCLLGVTRQILELLKTSEMKYKLDKLKWEQVNKRLTAIKPPHEVYRLPRSTADMSKWKASEFDSWLLYWSILCLEGIVDDSFLEMYALLVRSINTLLKRRITNEDIIRSEYDLLQFVGNFQVAFSKLTITFNIHSLLHLGESIKQSGPLLDSSAFAFENGIFRQKQCINGPRGVSHQIVKKFLKKKC